MICEYSSCYIVLICNCCVIFVFWWFVNNVLVTLSLYCNCIFLYWWFVSTVFVTLFLCCDFCTVFVIWWFVSTVLVALSLLHCLYIFKIFDGLWVLFLWHCPCAVLAALSLYFNGLWVLFLLHCLVLYLLHLYFDDLWVPGSGFSRCGLTLSVPYVSFCFCFHWTGLSTVTDHTLSSCHPRRSVSTTGEKSV